MGHLHIRPFNNTLVESQGAVIPKLKSKHEGLHESQNRKGKNIASELLLHLKVSFRVIRNLPLYFDILFFVSVVLLGGFIEVVGFNYFDRNRLLGSCLIVGGGGITCCLWLGCRYRAGFLVAVSTMMLPVPEERDLPNLKKADRKSVGAVVLPD